LASSKPLTKPLLFGRAFELNQVLESISTEEKSSSLITGESGVGKSQFLDALYYKLKEHQDGNVSKLFIGYYERKEALVAETDSLIYPFNVALSSLVKNIKEEQQLEERVGQTFKRLQKTLKEFVRDESLNMAEALIEDIADKAGLKLTFKWSKGIWDRFKNQKTSLMSLEEYITKNSKDALNFYINLCKSMASEFEDRKFVLLFDQFEYVGKATVDFLLNFIHFMPNQLHVIVSFRTDDDIFNELSYKKLFSDSKNKIINELNGKEVKLKGLSAEDIGNWIYSVKGIRLQLVPDLNRIQESSAGLPFLLNEWIMTSKELKYEEIQRGKICEHVSKLEENMDDINMIRLYKIAILNQKLDEKDLANYLGIQDIDYVLPFVKELINRRIFDSYEWFRHKLIQKCIEDDISNERKQRYHGEAAKFYYGLVKREVELNSLSKYHFQNYLGYAYHIYEEGRNYESAYISNNALGQVLVKIGNLDLAEKCYMRALTASRNLNNSGYEMDTIFSLTANVYQIWGRYGEAIANYETLLKYYKKNKDKANISQILNSLGLIHKDKGEYNEAKAKFNESLAIAKELGDKGGIASTLNSLGLIYSIQGNLDEAKAKFNESLAIEMELNHKREISFLLNNLGIIHKDKGEYNEAISKYNESLAIKRELGDKRGMSFLFNNLGLIHYYKGEYNEAISKYNESLAIAKELGVKEVVERNLYYIDLTKSKMKS
jgi:tetratricopeptide (TPR) repeat protein